MTEINWDRPIRVGTGRGYAQTIKGPKEALTCLSTLLTTKCEFAVVAEEECFRALRRATNPEQARRATVAALLNARVAFV